MKKTFKIEGMHCNSCAMLIDMDIEDLPGVKLCKTSYAKSKTEVEFEESKIKPETLIEVIKNTGYKAILV